MISTVDIGAQKLSTASVATLSKVLARQYAYVLICSSSKFVCINSTIYKNYLQQVKVLYQSMFINLFQSGILEKESSLHKPISEAVQAFYTSLLTPASSSAMSEN